MKAKIKHQADHDRQPLHKLIPLKAPLVVYIEPSGYCNLKCNFCPQTTNKMKKDSMPLELFKHCIDKIKQFNKPIKMLRVCGNGEPLYNLDILKMLEYAQKSKIFQKIELVTNGILLNKSHIENLYKYCSRIIISIEGLSGSDYEAMCGRRIIFDYLINNIQKLYINKRRNCTLMIKTINEAVKTSERQRAFYKLFSNICDEIYIENLVPMWPGLDSKYNNQSRWEKDEISKREVCVQIFKGFQIQADGDIVACCVDWERKNFLGNIKDKTLIEIWNSEILKNLQIAHLRGSKDCLYPCNKCVMNDTCDPDNIDDYRLDLLKRFI